MGRWVLRYKYNARRQPKGEVQQPQELWPRLAGTSVPVTAPLSHALGHRCVRPEQRSTTILFKSRDGKQSRAGRRSVRTSCL